MFQTLITTRYCNAGVGAWQVCGWIDLLTNIRVKYNRTK